MHGRPQTWAPWARIFSPHSFTHTAVAPVQHLEQHQALNSHTCLQVPRPGFWGQSADAAKLGAQHIPRHSCSGKRLLQQSHCLNCDKDAVLTPGSPYKGGSGADAVPVLMLI